MSLTTRGRALSALLAGAALLLVAAPAALQSGAGAASATATSPSLAGCDVLPPFSGRPKAASAADLRAFNQRIDRAPKQKRSRRYARALRGLGGNQSLHPDFGSNPDFGIPFTTVPSGQPLVEVKIGPDGFPDESDFGPAPIPPEAPIEGGGDRHVLVVQQGSCRLYELYRAEFLGGPGNTWQADATAGFDLGSAGLRPAGWTSADAAGLPILPGLVRYEEVAAGAVKHAIRVTFEQTRRSYLKPATHYASSSCDRYLPPMGLRLRLKRRYFRSHFADFPSASQSRPIFEALRRYGLIVADNGSNWFFSGATDPRWNDDDLSRLKDVPGKAFEVVRSKARETSPC